MLPEKKKNDVPSNAKKKWKEIQEDVKYHSKTNELKNVKYDSDGMVDVTFSDIPPEKKNRSILTLPTDWNYVPPEKK